MSPWTKFATSFYRQQKSKNNNYKFSQALKAAAQVYKKGGNEQHGGLGEDGDNNNGQVPGVPGVVGTGTGTGTDPVVPEKVVVKEKVEGDEVDVAVETGENLGVSGQVTNPGVPGQGGKKVKKSAKKAKKSAKKGKKSAKKGGKKARKSAKKRKC